MKNSCILAILAIILCTFTTTFVNAVGYCELSFVLNKEIPESTFHSENPDEYFSKYSLQHQTESTFLAYFGSFMIEAKLSRVYTIWRSRKELTNYLIVTDGLKELQDKFRTTMEIVTTAASVGFPENSGFKYESGTFKCGSLSSKCYNDVQDEGETDIDCGGPSCVPCSYTYGCVISRDCGSKWNACVNGQCELYNNANGYHMAFPILLTMMMMAMIAVFF